MELPVGLPKHLLPLGEIENENAMLQALAKEPENFTLFFECACRDRLWAASHLSILAKMLGWMTHHFYRGVLPFEIAERVQRQVFSQSDLVSKFLPKDIAILVEEKSYPVNSLMLAVSSLLIYGAFRKECSEKGGKTLEIPEFSHATPEVAVEYLHTGKVEGLWKKPSNILLHILREAAEADMQGLADYCANIYKRYLDRDNVAGILHLSHQPGWNTLKHECIAFINDQQFGASVEENEELGGLNLYVHNYSKETMALYKRVADEITLLGFEGDLMEDPLFLETIEYAPNLRGISLVNTLSYTDAVKKLPSSLELLDLSICDWLNTERLKAIIAACPYLRVLKLHGDVQLDYHSWSQLTQLKNLEILELAGCTQLQDDDLLLITRGCPKLEKLNIDRCFRVTDQVRTRLLHLKGS